MRVAVSCREGQKQLKVLALHIKRTWTRQPIYDGAYLERMYTALVGNPVGVTQPSLIILFCTTGQKTLEVSTSL